MATTINPDVLSFFSELEDNNNREWFEPQKKRFKALETEVKAFATDLTAQMNEHDSVDKFKLFRLYRDVRFSKDKTPFKTPLWDFVSPRKTGLSRGLLSTY